MADKAYAAAVLIKARGGGVPRVGLILGSGLGGLADRLTSKNTIPYSDIPGFPMPTVEGHVGNYVAGSLKGVPAGVMQGRFHHYEGYYMKDITFPVRVFSALGVRTLVVTSASGGIREDLAPGRVMAVTDHINLMGTNPLLGLESDEAAAGRFVDLTGAYDPELLDTARAVSHRMGFDLAEGVLAAVSGPCYETPAEVRMLGAMGADAVCMSTVPEVVMARYLGMRVLGLTLITNRAAGLGEAGPSHHEVLDMAGRRHEEFSMLVEGIVAVAEKAGLV